MSNYTPTKEEITAVKGKGFLLDKTTGRHFNARVLTVNGKMTSEQMKFIADAARKFGNGSVALTTRLTVEIQHIPYENIYPLIEYLESNGYDVGGTGPRVRPIVSCKGTTCHFGLIDTYSLSEKIHYRFYKGYHQVKLPHKFKIAVGGCPNNCVKPSLNDVGIIGARVPVINAEKCRGCKICAVEKACPVGAAHIEDGKISIPKDECNSCGRCKGKCPFGAVEEYVDGYKLYIGGRWGKKYAIGRPLTHVFTTEDEILDVIEACILLFKDKGITGERFSDTIERLGFENVEAELCGGDLLQRKADIINKP